MVSCISCDHGVDIGKNRDREIKVTLEINEGVFDITGSKVWFSVKSDLDDADVDALITKKNLAAGGDDSEIKITDGPAGILSIYIKPADTLNMEAGDYWWDCVLETPVQKKFQAVAPSRFSILQPVTIT